jgi:hypothetical protein
MTAPAAIKSAKEVDLVLNDQLLSQSLRDFGLGAADISDYKLNCPSPDHRALFMHAELHAVGHLQTVLSPCAGKLNDHANLNRHLGAGWRRHSAERDHRHDNPHLHEFLSRKAGLAFEDS